MTALAGVELESLVSEPDALITRPPPVFISAVKCMCSDIRTMDIARAKYL